MISQESFKLIDRLLSEIANSPDISDEVYQKARAAQWELYGMPPVDEEKEEQWQKS